MFWIVCRSSQSFTQSTPRKTSHLTRHCNTWRTYLNIVKRTMKPGFRRCRKHTKAWPCSAVNLNNANMCDQRNYRVFAACCMNSGHSMFGHNELCHENMICFIGSVDNDLCLQRKLPRLSQACFNVQAPQKKQRTQLHA